MAVGNGVKTKHKDFDAYAKKWKRCRDVVSGQDAIYAGNENYLPKLKDETPDDYKNRQNRTPFYNASWRTIAGFVGMMFRKPPSVVVPASIEPLLEDINAGGVSFSAFVQDCATEDLEVSRLGVLVDYPTQQTNEDGTPILLTIAEKEKRNLRPVMHQYKAESIINWEYGRVGNKTVLIQVRLLETHIKAVNEFENEEELRIRVLDLKEGSYRVRVYNEENEEQIGGDVYPTMNGDKMSFIPFFFIGPDGTEGTLDDPVLIDLVDLNIKHFMVSADYEHGCHMTGLPTAVISGYQPGFNENGAAVTPDFYIGSKTAWVFPDPNTKAEYLEFTGQGLTAIKENLDRKEAQMAAIGARMLAPEKSGVEAAGTLAMRHNGEYSILAAIAIAVSTGLLKALKVFVEWGGGNPDEVKFEISREFIPIIADSALLSQLMSLVQSGNLDKQSLFEWLKRADIVAHDMSFKDMQARIDSDPPLAPAALSINPLPEPEPDLTGEDE